MQYIFPWHEQVWQYLVNRKNIGKLPHAILIKGMKGVGKFVFAKNLAALLLCNDGSHKVTSCGKCDACVLLQAGNHPDLVIVQPEEQGKAIKIDQIREVIADLNNTPHQGGMKVVIIESAEVLNLASANALLKTLEEPALNTIIILASSHPMMLSATIRSRCQTLSIDVPKYSTQAMWLKQHLPDANVDLLHTLAENAPLKALSIATDGTLIKRQEFFNSLYELLQGKINVVQMAVKCKDWDLDNLLVMLMYIISDLIKIKFAANRNIVNKDQIEKLTDFSLKTNINKLLSYKDHIYKLRKYLLDRINLNQQMVIENLIILLIQL